MKQSLTNIIQKAKSAYAKAKAFLDSDRWANRSMRWARPIALMLSTLMFVVGWHSPATLMAFAQALAVLPDNFWNVIFILLGSLATTKLLRDLGDKKP